MNRFDNPFGNRQRRNVNIGSVTTRQRDATLGITVRFRRPSFGAVFPVTNASALRKLFIRLQGATIRIKQYDTQAGRPDVVYESGDITVSSFSKFKERFFAGDSDGEWIPDITDYRGFTKIIVARRVAVPEGGFTQQFREGVTNCLLLPISAWVDTLNVEKTKKAARNKIAKFQKKYPYGVPQDALDDICIALNINIDILAPFSKRVIRKGRTNKKEPKKSFYLDNTYQNHITLEEPEPVFLEPSDMGHWELKKNDMYWDSPSNDKKRSIYKVRRGDTIYTTKPANEEIEFYTKMSDVGFCYTKHPKLKEFIQSSIHYTGCMNFVFEADEIIEARDCRHIDQKKS